MFNLNLPWWNLMPLSLVLFLVTLEKRPTPNVCSSWRPWKSALGSTSIHYSSAWACVVCWIKLCFLLQQAIFKAVAFPSPHPIPILSMWLQSISFHNRFLLLFPQACKWNFTQHRNLCSTRMLAWGAAKKIALLLNMVCVNRTPLSFHFESKHLSKFICATGKTGVS